MFLRSILLCCLSLAAAGWCLASRTMPFDPKSDRYVYLSDLSETQQFPGVHDVLVCPEGTRLPLSFSFIGDLFELNAPENGVYDVLLKKTLYLRLAQEQIYLSLDNMNWKTWDQLLTGTIAVKLSQVQDSPHLQLSGEANLR